MGRISRTLSTKISVEDYNKFIQWAEQLGLSPSALLRRLLEEFLGKPLEEYDRVLRMEKEIEKLKSDILDLRRVVYERC